MGSYADDRPKCLTEFGGMTLIGRQLSVLRKAGLDDIVIATGYRHEMLALPGTRQVFNPDWQSTNMVETLFCAEAEFGDDVIVSYGDIVYEPRVVRALLDSPHDISVIVDKNWRAYWENRSADPLSDAESLSMEADGRITDIGSPAASLDDIQAQYIGLTRYRGEGIKAIKDAHANWRTAIRPWMEKRPAAKAYITDLLTEIILLGGEVRAVPIDGGWLEFDTVSDYESGLEMLENGTISRFFDPESARGPGVNG